MCLSNLAKPLKHLNFKRGTGQRESCAFVANLHETHHKARVHKDILGEKNLSCSWKIRWTELSGAKREGKQNRVNRVRAGAEKRRGPGNDKGHYYAGSSHFTKYADTRWYFPSLNLASLLCEMEYCTKIPFFSFKKVLPALLN